MKTLPEQCMAQLQSTGKFIAIKRGESGYYKTTVYDVEHAQVLNDRFGATEEDVVAMYHGSMFGWGVPGADATNEMVKSLAQGNRDEGVAVTFPPPEADSWDNHCQ